MPKTVYDAGFFLHLLHWIRSGHWRQFYRTKIEVKDWHLGLRIAITFIVKDLSFALLEYRPTYLKR